MLAMDITVRFGRNLRAYRIQRQLSQEDLGEIAGLHRTYISGLERGTRNPSIRIVAQLATALEIEPGDLLRGGPTK